MVLWSGPISALVMSNIRPQQVGLSGATARLRLLVDLHAPVLFTEIKKQTKKKSKTSAWWWSEILDNMKRFDCVLLLFLDHSFSVVPHKRTLLDTSTLHHFYFLGSVHPRSHSGSFLFCTVASAQGSSKKSILNCNK